MWVVTAFNQEKAFSVITNLRMELFEALVGTVIMLGAGVQILVQVNTDENPELKAMFSVTTYPRVLLFTAGSRYEPLKYEKSWGLSFEPVNSWLKQQLD